MCNISRSVLPCDTSVGLCCHVQHQLVSDAMCNISWLMLTCVTSVGLCCHVKHQSVSDAMWPLFRILCDINN
ncbi:hypothetical protein DPMN_001998 [Dreissena polymorpha]|uniref:Uncharacterized protein n=1 Tax=Dreissena polymorpha TaxID=45954 RepID=A0A9D4RRC3_DREPO|nr:hypothetical protein DPMN_001998 [Dreissena polymorpha]